VSRTTKATDAEVEHRLAAIEYARGSVAHLAPGRNLADELIADRRAEMVADRPIADKKEVGSGEIQ
jgi:hypothetical protein